MSDGLKDLLKEVVIPGVIAIVLIGTACYMAILGRQVPEWLYALGGIVVGYFTNYAAASRAYRR